MLFPLPGVLPLNFFSAYAYLILLVPNADNPVSSRSILFLLVGARCSWQPLTPETDAALESFIQAFQVSLFVILGTIMM